MNTCRSGESPTLSVPPAPLLTTALAVVTGAQSTPLVNASPPRPSPQLEQVARTQHRLLRRSPAVLCAGPCKPLSPSPTQALSPPLPSSPLFQQVASPQHKLLCRRLAACVAPDAADPQQVSRRRRKLARSPYLTARHGGTHWMGVSLSAYCTYSVSKRWGQAPDGCKLACSPHLGEPQSTGASTK